MLGGNAEYMAKNDLRKAGLSDELIAEATGYAETDDQEILDARALFAEALARAQGRDRGRGRPACARPAACSSSAPSATTPAASTTSCAAVPAVRATRARRASTSRSRTICMRLFGGERITNLMDRMNLDEDTPIENKMLSEVHRERTDQRRVPQLPVP